MTNENGPFIRDPNGTPPYFFDIAMADSLAIITVLPLIDLSAAYDAVKP